MTNAGMVSHGAILHGVSERQDCQRLHPDVRAYINDNFFPVSRRTSVCLKAACVGRMPPEAERRIVEL